MIICNISGVPLIIHMKTLVMYLSGLNFDSAQALITIPSGIAISKVRKNIPIVYL